MTSDFEKIVLTLKKNQEIAQVFFEIEASILSILNFKDFLEILLNEIRDKRQIPFVWISLIENSDVSNMIRKSVPPETLIDRVSTVDRNLFLKIVGNKTDPILTDHELSNYHMLIPEQYRNRIKSLAIAPLTLDGKLIGSLNHGDVSGYRYRPNMDTTLLKQLTTIVSICLSNVMAHEKLNLLASTDPLTGLLNRRVLEQVLKREMDRAVRYLTPLSLVFIDLDDFKKVNDHYGHKTGDDLLNDVARNLLYMTRGSDIVARFGGDEFVIILPNTPYHDACEFSERLHDFLIHHPFMTDAGDSIPVSMSYGVSCRDDQQSNDLDSLLQRADEMLYQIKRKKTGNHSRL